MAMATVPEKVPREKIRAQTRAMTSVGRVRMSARMKRKMLTITALRLMLEEARIATGMAMAQPMTVPRMDILMVSNRGLTTLGKNSQLGWKIFFSRSSILENRLTMTARSKPVIFSAHTIASASASTMSGVRLLGRRTVCPFSRVMTWGLNILSKNVSL